MMDNLKLVKMIVIAVLSAVIVYYVPSILLGYNARIPISQPEYKPLGTAISGSEMEKEATIRAYAENVSKIIIAEASSTAGILNTEQLGDRHRVFIYNFIFSIAIAAIAFTIIRRVYG